MALKAATAHWLVSLTQLGGEGHMWGEFPAQKNPMARAGFEHGTFRSRYMRLTTRPPSPQIGDLMARGMAKPLMYSVTLCS